MKINLFLGCFFSYIACCFTVEANGNHWAFYRKNELDGWKTSSKMSVLEQEMNNNKNAEAGKIYSGDPMSKKISTYVYLCRSAIFLDKSQKKCEKQKEYYGRMCNGLSLGVIRIDEQKNGGEFSVFAAEEDKNKEEGGSIVWSAYLAFNDNMKIKYFYNKSRYNREYVSNKEKFDQNGDIKDQDSFLHDRQGNTIIYSNGAYTGDDELSIESILKRALLRWKVNGVETLSQLFERLGELGVTKFGKGRKRILPPYNKLGWFSGCYNCALFAEAALCKLGALGSITGCWCTIDNSPESVVNRIIEKNKNSKNLQIVVHTSEEVKRAVNSENSEVPCRVYPQFVRDVSKVGLFYKLGEGKEGVFLNTEVWYKGGDIPNQERVFQEYLKLNAESIEEYKQHATIADKYLQNATTIQEYLRKANISYKTSKKGICSSKRCDIVKVLLKVGANVDATDSFGRTALMYEVLSKAINIAKL